MNATDQAQLRHVRRRAGGIAGVLALTLTLTLATVACGSDAPSADDAGDELAEVDAEVDAEVVATDAAAVVDSVVDDAEAGRADLAQALRDNGLDSAAGIVEQIDLDELIASEEFTFLAPSNEAFTTLDAQDAADLLTDPAMIVDVLRNHLLADTMSAEELAAAETVESEAGETLTITGEGDTLEINGVAVATRDIEVGDGVVHVVDGFLLTE